MGLKERTDGEQRGREMIRVTVPRDQACVQHLHPDRTPHVALPVEEVDEALGGRLWIPCHRLVAEELAEGHGIWAVQLWDLNPNNFSPPTDHRNMSRPEHISPPEIYYGDIEATKYTQKYVPLILVECTTPDRQIFSTRIQTIQSSMTHRAIELLALPEGSSPLLLDIGCGSGLSGEILDESGYEWVGVDVAPSMLRSCSFHSFFLVERLGDNLLTACFLFLGSEVALEREVQGDLFLQDIGQGFGYRAGSFDGAIRFAFLPLSRSPLVRKT